MGNKAVVQTVPQIVYSTPLSGKLWFGLAVIGVTATLIYLLYRYVNRNSAPSGEPNSFPPSSFSEQQIEIIAQQEVRSTSQQEARSTSVSSISTNAAIAKYKHFRCGLTSKLMVDPVNLKCSHEFSRQPIEKWLERNKKCPLCHQPANKDDLRGLTGMAKEIEIYKKKLQKKGQEWSQKHRIGRDFDEENSA